MILYPMNQLLSNVSSRYELVNLVAHRARQLYGEAEKKKEELEEKPVTIALNEAMAGTLVAETYEDAEQAEEPEEQSDEACEEPSEEQSEEQPDEESAVPDSEE